MTFSKFDTQIQIEETDYEPTAADLAEIEAYEPTAADLAELNAWLDEVESEVAEYAYEDWQIPKTGPAPKIVNPLVVTTYGDCKILGIILRKYPIWAWLIKEILLEWRYI